MKHDDEASPVQGVVIRQQERTWLEKVACEQPMKALEGK